MSNPMEITGSILGAESVTARFLARSSGAHRSVRTTRASLFRVMVTGGSV